MEEAERKASEEYIQRLLAEEEERVEEERRRQEERQLEDDEKLARLLSEELVSVQTVLHFVLLIRSFLSRLYGAFNAHGIKVFVYTFREESVLKLHYYDFTE